MSRLHQGKYRSVSAFAPICNPIKCPWGQKAFGGYLGSDTKTWEVKIHVDVSVWWWERVVVMALLIGEVMMVAVAVTMRIWYNAL